MKIPNKVAVLYSYNIVNGKSKSVLFKHGAIKDIEEYKELFLRKMKEGHFLCFPDEVYVPENLYILHLDFDVNDLNNLISCSGLIARLHETKHKDVNTQKYLH